MEIQNAYQTRHRNRTDAGRDTVTDVLNEVQPKLQRLSVGNRQTTTQHNAKSENRSHRIHQYSE